MFSSLRHVTLFGMFAMGAGRWQGGDASLWRDFKVTFNKHYANATEESYRHACFLKNLNRIEDLNSLDPEGATHAVNVYADICPHEFAATYLGLKYTPRRKLFAAAPLPDHLVKSAAAAKAIDWRDRGAVTQVKNQGACGSCWAFSATGNMEGVNFLATGNLVSLSEEELVECSRPSGCQGGIMDEAFDWVKANGGITTEDDYPYTSGLGTSGVCRQAKLAHDAVTVRGFVDLPENEDQIAAWVAEHGPVSVAVDAAAGWQLYTGGIKRSCNTTGLDHGVLIVGFGQTAGIKFWIVKNSWGAAWGEGGYIRLQRGVNCNGIAQHAVSAR